MPFSIRSADLRDALLILSKIGATSDVHLTLVVEESVLPDGFSFTPKHADIKFAKFLQAPQCCLLIDYATTEVPDNVVLIACPASVEDGQHPGHWNVGYEDLAAVSSFLNGAHISVTPSSGTKETGAVDTLLCTCDKRQYTLQCNEFVDVGGPDAGSSSFASRRINVMRFISKYTQTHPFANVLPCTQATWFTSILKDEDAMTIGFVKITRQGREQHHAVLMTVKRSETILLSHDGDSLSKRARDDSADLLAQVASAAEEAALEQTLVEFSGNDVKRVMSSADPVDLSVPGARARRMQHVEVDTKYLPLFKARSGTQGYVCVQAVNSSGMCIVFGMSNNVAAVSNFMAYVKET